MISAFGAFALTQPYVDSSMVKFLRIDLLGPSGPAQLARLESGEVYVGREPGTPTGVTVENTAISRQHGLFFRTRNHWLYKDLGSTNGSWLNGKPLKAGTWKILHSGDVLQLADSALAIHEERADNRSASSSTGRALIVFSRGQFQDEFPVPEYGRALVVGGSRSDLALDGDLAELPTLVIERRGERICAFGLAKEQKVLVNDAEMVELLALRDSDEIKVGQYAILFSDPTTAQRAPGQLAQTGTPVQDSHSVTGTGAPVEQTTKLSGMRGWANDSASGAETGFISAKTQPRLPFGQAESESRSLDETISIDASEFASRRTHFDRHPSMRYDEEEVDRGGGSAMDAIEDKVIIIIGFLLLLTLLALLVWWVFV